MLATAANTTGALSGVNRPERSSCCRLLPGSQPTRCHEQGLVPLLCHAITGAASRDQGLLEPSAVIRGAKVVATGSTVVATGLLQLALSEARRAVRLHVPGSGSGMPPQQGIPAKAVTWKRSGDYRMAGAFELLSKASKVGQGVASG